MERKIPLPTRRPVIGLFVPLGSGEKPFLMRSDLEPNFAHVHGTDRDDRVYGIEFEKLAFCFSDPLGRAGLFYTNVFISPERDTGKTSSKRSPSRIRATRRIKTRSDGWTMLKHSRVILPCSVTSHELLVDRSTNSIGGDVMGEAAREAPAQAELRPTSAGTSRVDPPCERRFCRIS
jgi:hypothetical protein